MPTNWNMSIGANHTIMGTRLGWGYLYVTTAGGHLMTYNATTGKLLNTSEIGNQYCSIWSGQTPIMPLMVPDTAVVAESNAVVGFEGTSLDNVIWSTPDNFTCTNMLHVSRNGKAVVFTNHTVLGVASATNGDFLWLYRYTNYANYANQAIIFTWIDVRSTSEFFVLEVNMPNSSSQTTITLHDGLTGEAIWSISQNPYVFLQYDPVHDLVIENGNNNFLRGRHWRNWTKGTQVWEVAVPITGQGFTVLGGAVIWFGGPQVTVYNSGTGARMWSINVTNPKQQSFTLVGEYVFYSYSDYSATENYLTVHVQKLRLSDGSLLWTQRVGTVLYGWFSARVSDDDKTLFIHPTINADWIISLKL